jgi:predicted transcriptional regulator
VDVAIATTLKLPEDLKERVNEAAMAAGKSPHAFMVEAIELQTQLAERRREFVTSALVAEQEVAQYGLVYDGDEVLSYLKARLAGTKAARPRKRKL